MPNHKPVELQFISDFASQLNGRQIVSVDVGPENEVLVLAATGEIKEAALGRHIQPGWASFPMSKVAPYRADVLKFAPDFRDEMPVEVEEAYPFIQPLLNGQILIVAARCENRDGDPERNAAVYHADGTLSHRFVMGDGIEHVQVARDGSIWTGYSDEGIFGNFGWGVFSHGEQKEPIGSHGLVRFDTQGNILWRFKPSEGCSFIAACYTLNVGSELVWTCPYTDFAVVRIEPDGQKRGWQNEFSGPRALVTDANRVLLFGGYSENRNRCVVQDLGDNTMKNPRQIELVLPGDGDLTRVGRAQITCRGSIVHFFVGTGWLQLDLAQHDV